jgi:hypothetical protein
MNALEKIYQTVPENRIIAGGKPGIGWDWKGKFEGELNVPEGSVLYPHQTLLNKTLRLFVDTDAGSKYAIHPKTGEHIPILQMEFKPGMFTPKSKPLLNGWGLADPVPKLKFSKGVPKELTPLVDYSFFVPSGTNAPLSVPMMRKIISSDGAPGSLKLFDSYMDLFKEMSYIRPKEIRNPIQFLDSHPMTQKLGGAEFVRILHETAGDKFTVYGTTTQSLQSRFF